MAEIIEERIVSPYIECTLALGSACLYIPRGVFDRTWLTKKTDGTVVECKVKEFGHCFVNNEGNNECRCYVRYQTPEGSFVNYNKYGGIYLYPSYEDAVRSTNALKPYVCYDVDYADRHKYEKVCIKDMFKDMGFTDFEFMGTWHNLLVVNGFRYVNGNIRKEAIKSTMWVDKDGLHIEPVLPDGVFKTKEEAYASNMPRLITFDGVEEEREPSEKDKRIAVLEKIIRNAQDELNKLRKQ